MITLQDHIDELRAELRGCLTRREHATIKAELTVALLTQNKRDDAVTAHDASDGR